MDDDEFKRTPIWMETLSERPDGDLHKTPRGRLRHSYLLLRDTIAELFTDSFRDVSDFTLHDKAHIDALWETASMICGDVIELNPAEAYVLGCAFVFHDAAMGRIPATEDVPAFMGHVEWRDLLVATFLKMKGRWPNDTEFDDPPDDVHEACLAEAIRQTHAKRGAALVTKPFPSESLDDVSYLISDDGLRRFYGQLVGDLAASHWSDVGELPQRFRHSVGSMRGLPTKWTIEPLKLACILRIADATQLDSRRAPSLTFTSRAPRGASWNHWRFQEFLSRPQLNDDRVLYSSMQPFKPKEAAAWWLALDYLRSVDRELRLVDSLLHDLKKDRLAARGVAYVDQPERFAEVFHVDGWRPVDVNVTISDVPKLIGALGGEQLYGPAPEVAIRELIQNAQDAVLARQAIHQSFNNGEIVVSLQDQGGSWVLQVRDNGLGMDEAIIRDGLLDFGQSGWRTNAVRSKFVGLASADFRPTGTFGIGFYSTFMLGDEITVTTRCFDLGRDDARELLFDEGLTTRPLLCPPSHDTHIDPGTVIEVRLKTNPLAPDGLLVKAGEPTLTGLIQRLVPSRKVVITVNEWHEEGDQVLPAFDLSSASAREVFDQLYPERQAFRMSYTQRAELRKEFCAQATEVVDEDGQRLGLAMLEHGSSSRRPEMDGVVLVDGFRADEHPDFTGYLSGKPSRASRDKVQLTCTPKQLGAWIASQEQLLWEQGLFDHSAQLKLAETIYEATDHLEGDHSIALTADGLLRVNDTESWALDRYQVTISFGSDLQWDTQRAALRYQPTGEPVKLPEDWLVLCPPSSFAFIDTMFPRRGDPCYAQHQHDHKDTWQKLWWLMSGGLSGLVIKHVCRAWSCQPGDILAPVADRNWNDHGELHLREKTVKASVLYLQRP